MARRREAQRLLVGTDKGVARGSIIKRQHQSQRWGKKMLREMQGTPQQPDPSKTGLHISVRIKMDPPVQVDMLEFRPQREEDMPKGAYIKRRRFEKFGYTEDCEG